MEETQEGSRQSCRGLIQLCPLVEPAGGKSGNQQLAPNTVHVHSEGYQLQEIQYNFSLN